MLGLCAAAFHKMGLPQQLVHGDLHYDNVMVRGRWGRGMHKGRCTQTMCYTRTHARAQVINDRVSGLLDFEFATHDWRAMELAVALSK